MSEPTTEVLDTKPLTFAQWIETHARGTVNDEATAAFAELVDACITENTGGTLTLKVSVAPSGKGITVLTDAVVAIKKPRPAPEASLFFTGIGGRLHRNDPTHPQMVDRDARVITDAADDDAVRRLDTDDPGDARRLDTDN